MSEEETYLHERLRELREQYEHACAPYVKRLIAIRRTRTPVLVLPVDEASRLGDVLVSVKETP